MSDRGNDGPAEEVRPEGYPDRIESNTENYSVGLCSRELPRHFIASDVRRQNVVGNTADATNK